MLRLLIIVRELRRLANKHMGKLILATFLSMCATIFMLVFSVIIPFLMSIAGLFLEITIILAVLLGLSFIMPYFENIIENDIKNKRG